ncbi:small glutamine-rich tetratricopeptide repeat-containing protein [Melia azedarach]|uniref:Small glutamine-rich tetratricopeptide repeat-containing protein n=1 Tax=Melia azedarach TaxID=155640 RepID=A0ACC1WNG1_MELAZ|nr:small glutamine-rich tetratricopeptide repeat-containing protein [Melia azedarach]
MFDREPRDTLEIESDNGPSSSSAQNVDAKFSEASKSLSEDWTKESSSTGVSRDELFGQFFAALEKINYFKTLPDGNDDPSQVDKASRLFHDALNEMERSGSPSYNQKNLAETFKSQGNRAMQSKQYSDAIELYSFAIALYENNAVYYCNRAAAYTQIHEYAEAIRDCLKSIDIDPNYCKAYSRLGLAYCAQGNYNDCIEKGFKKALQLDPNNESVKENMRMAEQKLKEEMQRTGRDQSTSSSRDNQESNQSTGGFRSHGTPTPFTMPFDINALPTDIASMLTNMASNIHQGQHSPPSQGQESNFSEADEPGVRIGGNISLNLGENVPEDLTAALRSMMEMFSESSSQRNNPQDPDNSRNGSSATN